MCLGKMSECSEYVSTGIGGLFGAMAYGLDDSDFEEFLDSSSDEELEVIKRQLSVKTAPPALIAVTACAAREALLAACGDASRLVPPNRQPPSFPLPCTH